MNFNKVSIIVPVYNCETTISRCVNSVLNQTYNNIELILINDGSKDSSDYICKNFLKRHSNIIYYHQENAGAAAARNIGITHATGKYIMFLDADDYLDCTIVERLAACLDNDEQLDVVACSYITVETQKKEYMFKEGINASTFEEKEPFFLQLMDYTYGHNKESSTAIGVPWGKLFRKALLDDKNILFDNSLPRMQDNIFIMEVFYYADKIKYIPENLYYYSVGHINSYANINYAPTIYISVLKKRTSFFNTHKELLSKKVRNMLYYEHVNYLMMSIHYIIAKNGNKEAAIKDIDNLCENTIYSTVLDTYNNSISLKQKLQILLVKHHLYSLLYWIYKFKYHL